jgi:hypothetical protein
MTLDKDPDSHSENMAGEVETECQNDEIGE